MSDSDQGKWDPPGPDQPDNRSADERMSPDASSPEEPDNAVYEYYSPEAGAHYAGPGEEPGYEDEDSGMVTPSWERREELGFADALLRSIPEILFHPIYTFHHMPVTGGIAGPLLFVILLGTVGSIFQTFYSILGVRLDMFIPETEYVSEFQARANVMLEIILMVLSPILVAIITFIGAGIAHLFLMLFGGAKRGFEATFRVMAYAGGATALLSIIPLCGTWILLVWGVVCEIIGLREAHRTDTWRAVLAFLVPLFLCCCIMVAAAFALGLLVGVAQDPELIESLR